MITNAPFNTLSSNLSHRILMPRPCSLDSLYNKVKNIRTTLPSRHKLVRVCSGVERIVWVRLSKYLSHPLGKVIVLVKMVGTPSATFGTDAEA